MLQDSSHDCSSSIAKLPHRFIKSGQPLTDRPSSVLLAREKCANEGERKADCLIAQRLSRPLNPSEQSRPTVFRTEGCARSDETKRSRRTDAKLCTLDCSSTRRPAISCSLPQSGT